MLGWISSVGWSKLAGQVVSHVDRCVQKMHGSMGAGGFPPQAHARGRGARSAMYQLALVSSFHIFSVSRVIIPGRLCETRSCMASGLCTAQDAQYLRT